MQDVDPHGEGYPEMAKNREPISGSVLAAIIFVSEEGDANFHSLSCNQTRDAVGDNQQAKEDSDAGRKHSLVSAGPIQRCNWFSSEEERVIL